MYIGRMGGSYNLFKLRRARGTAGATTQSVGLLSRKVHEDDAWIQHELLNMGVLDEAQAYWRLVVPRSDLLAAARLLPFQKDALRQVRTLAKSNHERAMIKLQKRMTKLGYKDVELWMTLAWIRELAPIIVHLNLDCMYGALNSDTHYRNQFETAASGGLLEPKVREKWERDLFTGAYDSPEVTGFDRCKYGVVNIVNDYRGVVRCAQYGDSYIVLKNVRLRCSFSPMDSANLKADKLAVLDFYGHVLMEFSDDELRETVRVANGKDKVVVGDSCVQVELFQYKEAQIHGEIRFKDHVERLVADDRHNNGGWMSVELQSLCKRLGWKFSWMKDEQKRLLKCERQGLSKEDWKEHLTGLAEKGTPDAKVVPEGFCLKGCGRKVAEGHAKNGKPFTTCCRGCAMGLGHDQRCGCEKAKYKGDGLCKNGCGRKVNPGKSISGRPYETCCRGCVRGVHDASCGTGASSSTAAVVPGLSRKGSAENIRTGLCRMGCGRRVAESTNGTRRFDTCCRGCSTGKGHSANCKDVS